MKTFHNPENKQINFLDERFYTVDGETFFPSVTTVLDVYPKGFGFNNWLKDLGHNADEVLRKAGDQGSKVHDAIDMIIKGEQVRWTRTFVDTLKLQTIEEGAKFIDDCNNGKIGDYYKEVRYYTLDEWTMILRFIEFWEQVQPIVLANEFNIISANYRLGGTLDLVCEINGERWLIDFKTSNGIHTTHELQMSAYAMMFNEKNPEMPIHRTGILWLKALTKGPDSKGKSIQGKGWQLKEFGRHYTEAFSLFKHVRAIWDEENPNYKPKNLTMPDRVKIEVKRAGAADQVSEHVDLPPVTANEFAQLSGEQVYL